MLTAAQRGRERLNVNQRVKIQQFLDQISCSIHLREEHLIPKYHRQRQYRNMMTALLIGWIAVDLTDVCGHTDPTIELVTTMSPDSLYKSFNFVNC